jgi:hypothetical protein
MPKSSVTSIDSPESFSVTETADQTSSFPEKMSENPCRNPSER